MQRSTDYEISQEKMSVGAFDTLRMYKLEDSSIQIIKEIIDDRHLPELLGTLEYLASRRLDDLKDKSISEACQFIGMEIDKDWIRKGSELRVEPKETLFERLNQLVKQGTSVPLLVETILEDRGTLSLMVPFSCFKVDQRNPDKVLLQ